MTSFWRRAAGVAVIAVGILGVWRIHGLMQAERFAGTDPSRALRWSENPQARLALAESALSSGSAPTAIAEARVLLAHEPLTGSGYRVLGEALDRSAAKGAGLPLYRIAARRDPRDSKAGGLLVAHHLDAGDYPQALSQVDRLVRLAPGRTKAVNAILKQVAPLAQDRRFAEALVAVLMEEPPWRSTMLGFLRGHGDAYANVMEGLQNRAALSPDEEARWFDALISAGAWGEAQARWSAKALAGSASIPLLYNGAFAKPPTGSGFDWRMQQVPGVLAQFESLPDGAGKALRLEFLDQRVAKAGLEHPLMLFPGRQYRLQMKARAESLQAAIGLQWVLDCGGRLGVIARSAPMIGSFGWSLQHLEFTVPAERCPGQWLRLVNPVAKGAGQRVAGRLWLAEVSLQAVPQP